MATFRVAGQVARQFSTSAVKQKMVKAPIVIHSVEGRYASALYSAAMKENKLDAVNNDLNAFQELMKKDARFAEFLQNPTLNKAEKEATMKSIVSKQKYNNLTSNFLSCLAENSRLNKTTATLNAFGKIMKAHKGEVMCQVTTAKALDAANQKELKAALEGFLKKGQTLFLEMKVDPGLIGGMQVSIGDKFVDMSMQSKIKKYRELIESLL